MGCEPAERGKPGSQSTAGRLGPVWRQPRATRRVVVSRRAGWACEPAERKPGSQFTTCPAGPGTCALAERGKLGSRSTMHRLGLRAGLKTPSPLTPLLPPFHSLCPLLPLPSSPSLPLPLSVLPTEFPAPPSTRSLARFPLPPSLPPSLPFSPSPSLSSSLLPLLSPLLPPSLEPPSPPSLLFPPCLPHAQLGLYRYSTDCATATRL